VPRKQTRSKESVSESTVAPVIQSRAKRSRRRSTKEVLSPRPSCALDEPELLWLTLVVPRANQKASEAMAQLMTHSLAMNRAIQIAFM